MMGIIKAFFLLTLMFSCYYLGYAANERAHYEGSEGVENNFKLALILAAISFAMFCTTWIWNSGLLSLSRGVL